MINNIKVTQLNDDGKPLVSSYTEDGRQYTPASIQVVNKVDAHGTPISSGNIVTEKAPFSLSASASSPRTILERFSDTMAKPGTVFWMAHGM